MQAVERVVPITRRGVRLFLWGGERLKRVVAKLQDQDLRPHHPRIPRNRQMDELPDDTSRPNARRPKNSCRGVLQHCLQGQTTAASRANGRGLMGHQGSSVGTVQNIFPTAVPLLDTRETGANLHHYLDPCDPQSTDNTIFPWRVTVRG